MNNITILEQNRCLSCRSCEQSCSFSAVSFIENKEGFLYPVVNFQKCINCGKCVMHCPVLNPIKNETYSLQAYAAILKDENKIKQSSSGGVFSALAEQIIKIGGFVFGAAYDDKLQVKHISVSTYEELERLKGSKYVASDTGSTFSEVEKLLKKNKVVLYSGTPCQIAGLKVFLGKEYEKLITVDLICHGVPSQKLFNRYLELESKRNRGKIIYYGFRDKDICGWSCIGKAKLKTKKKIKIKIVEGCCDPYYATFLRGETYRESCYICQFANNQRVGDITIGDFWGVENFYPDLERKNGVSCVIINTRKGKEFFSKYSEVLNIIPSDIEKISEKNTNLKEPVHRPPIRDNVYTLIDDRNIKHVFKYCRYKNRIFMKIRNRISYFIPRKIKKIIKNLRNI